MESLMALIGETSTSRFTGNNGGAAFLHSAGYGA
jgi:hypothetical protein